MEEKYIYILSVQLLCGVFFVIALISDLTKEIIPNKLCLVVLVVSLFFHLLFGDYSQVIDGGLGFLVAFIMLFPFFYLRAIGGGDVKLMMCMGMLLGSELIFWTILYSIVAGGITSLLLTLKETGVKGITLSLKRYYQCFYLRQYFKPSEGEAATLRVPYAPALALGWLWACSQNQDVIWAISNFRHSL